MKKEINSKVRAATLLARSLARLGIDFVPMPVLGEIDRQKLVEESKERLAKLYGRTVQK